MFKPRKKTDFKTKDLYKFYKDNVRDPVSTQDYSKVLAVYNRKIIKELLKGKSFYFGDGLSYIKIMETRRLVKIYKDGNPNLPVNWAETKKQNLRDEEGKLIKIFITDQPYMYRTVWYNNKGNSLKDAYSFYKFHPCKEYKLGIFNAIKDNPAIINNFRFFKR